ncbi:MAG: hypothetical protein HY670_00030 [Chloroflexi bacterium]|nr:hypothetical protein [Chloroflexota bacterium]
MILKAVVFGFIVFGITLVVGFLVAAVIKAIGIVVQRGGKANEKSAE